MKHKILLIIIISCAVINISCTADKDKTTPTSKQAPVTAESSFTCQPDTILNQVRELLKGQTFAAHYLFIRHQFVLCVWLVVPEIAINADEKSVKENSRLAFLKGTRLAHTLVKRLPCMQKVFNAVNPMIVDSCYTCWYRDIISLDVLPQEDNPLDETLLNMIRGKTGEQAYLRTLPPTPESSSLVRKEAWSIAYQALQKALSPEKPEELISYPLAVNDFFIIELYWETKAENPDEDAIYEILDKAAASLADNLLPIDNIEAYFVAKGRLLFFCKIGEDVIKASASGYIRKDHILLHRVF